MADTDKELWAPGANYPAFFPGSIPAYPADLILLYAPGDEVEDTGVMDILGRPRRSIVIKEARYV